MAEMKAGYKQTDIGVIPEDWNALPLGDVSCISMGQSPLSKFYNTGEIGLPLVQGNADIKNRKTIIKQYSSQTTKLGKKGDIILTVRAPVGAVAKATFDCCLGRGVCSIHYPNDYLFYFLQKLENDWAKYTAGSTFDSINSEHIRKILIPLPKPEEQKQIAAALSDVDRLIESLSQLIAKKRDMKTAAMQQLLTGKKRLPWFDGEWEEKVVGDFGEVITGSTPSTKISDYWHGEIPWITPTDINKKKDISASEREISKLGLSVSRKLPAGSVLVTCIASIGKNAILRNEGACNQQINAIVPNLKYSSDFIYYLMEISKDYLIANAGITATRMISKKDFSDISFLVPKLEEQAAIATVLSDMDTEIEALEQRLAKALSLKTGMMHELLTGKTRLIKTNKKQEAA